MLYVRFHTDTDKAIGLNMISNGCEKVLKLVKEKFKNVLIILSGNMYMDKKLSMVNILDGKEYCIMSKTIINKSVVNMKKIVEINIANNMYGGALAGTTEGYNVHVANIIARIFIVFGQDIVQVINLSNCFTIMATFTKSSEVFEILELFDHKFLIKNFFEVLYEHNIAELDISHAIVINNNEPESSKNLSPKDQDSDLKNKTKNLKKEDDIFKSTGLRLMRKEEICLSSAFLHTQQSRK
ncbi:35295_t:CDS:2, partial [Racocetra persica]